MSEHKAKPVEGLVTSDGMQGRGGLSKKLRLVMMLVLAVVVLGAAGGFLYKQYIYKPAPKKSGSSVNRNSNDFLLHPDKQVSAAQTELNNAKTSQEKAAAYNHLGQAYLNSKQPQQAIDALNSSLSADSSTTNKLIALNALGFAYSRAGQRDKAIASFQQMIDILNASGNSAYRDEVPRVQSTIKEIQQGQHL